MVKRCIEAKIFLIVAVVCGLLLVFLVPPLQAADEPVHFANAYALSRGDPFPDRIDDAHLGHLLPENIYNYSVRYPWGIFNDTNAKYSYSGMIAESMSGAGLGGGVSRTGGEVPTGYLAAAGGMAAGTVLGNLFMSPEMNAQPYNQMVYGRIGNLIFYVIVTYFAICIIPRFKKSLLLLATMPMNLFLAASCSYDPLVHSITFLFFAVVLYMMKTGDKPVTKAEVSLVLLCTFFMVGAKQAYAPLLLLLLGIPKTKYGSVKKMIGCIAAVIVTAAIAYIPILIFNGRSAQLYSEGNTPITEAINQQHQWVSTHVPETIRAIWNTLSVKKQFYAESFWGKLGWLDTPFPVPMMTLGYTALLLTAVTEVFEWQPKEYGKFWKRLLPAAGVLVVFIGVELMMYLVHTPRPDVTGIIGNSFVEGVQGRYFIPLFIPLLMIFSNGWIRRAQVKAEKPGLDRAVSKAHRGICYLAGSGAVMCGAYTVLIVLLRYWI